MQRKKLVRSFAVALVSLMVLSMIMPLARGDYPTAFYKGYVADGDTYNSQIANANLLGQYADISIGCEVYRYVHDYPTYGHISMHVATSAALKDNSFAYSDQKYFDHTTYLFIYALKLEVVETGDPNNSGQMIHHTASYNIETLGQQQTIWSWATTAISIALNKVPISPLSLAEFVYSTWGPSNHLVSEWTDTTNAQVWWMSQSNTPRGLGYADIDWDIKDGANGCEIQLKATAYWWKCYINEGGQQIGGLGETDSTILTLRVDKPPPSNVVIWSPADGSFYTTSASGISKVIYARTPTANGKPFTSVSISVDGTWYTATQDPTYKDIWYATVWLSSGSPAIHHTISAKATNSDGTIYGSSIGVDVQKVQSGGPRPN